jgi:hypothetical protein
VGTELAVVADKVATLECLNATFGRIGTIKGLRLTFPVDRMVPVAIPGVVACWRYKNLDGQVLLGRAGNDGLQVFACEDKKVGHDLTWMIGPEARIWGDPMPSLALSWHTECARLLPSNFPFRTNLTLRELDELLDRTNKVELDDDSDGFPVVMIWGLPHLHPDHPRVRGYMSRMGPRRRVGPMDGETAPRDAVPTGTH